LNTSKKTENRIENEGENEFPGARPGLKPRKTINQSHLGNEKQAYFLPYKRALANRFR
jgi:hypothetical protein